MSKMTSQTITIGCAFLYCHDCLKETKVSEPARVQNTLTRDMIATQDHGP
jgi:hypothetical protein